MKKINIALGVAATLLVSGVAQADIATDVGTVKFNGAVLPKSCSINTTEQQVQLPDAYNTDINSEKTTGLTPFDINVTCPTYEGWSPKLVWDHTNTNVNEQGLLINESGSAKNVVLAILNDYGKYIPLNDPSNQTLGEVTGGGQDTNIIYKFKVGYLKDGRTADAVVAGSIITSATYKINYL